MTNKSLSEPSRFKLARNCRSHLITDVCHLKGNTYGLSLQKVTSCCTASYLPTKLASGSQEENDSMLGVFLFLLLPPALFPVYSSLCLSSEIFENVIKHYHVQITEIPGTYCGNESFCCTERYYMQRENLRSDGPFGTPEL